MQPSYLTKEQTHENAIFGGVGVPNPALNGGGTYSYGIPITYKKRGQLASKYVSAVCMQELGICLFVFVKCVNGGYAHTQYMSTGDATATGDIPSSIKALKLSKGDVLPT